MPIETDAALQVETLHQSMKKEQLIAWFLMLALALWIFFDMRKSFIRDFAAALSRLSALSAILDSVLLFLLCALELGGYYLWRRKAKREAELGRFLADALTSCVTDAGALGAGDGLCRCFVQ
ncbi:MAG: hypothetical protein V8T17_08055 [Oscillospiraceae bacterium]